MHDKRALQTEDILQLNVVSDPQFTPDGQAFTYTLTTIHEQNEYESQLMYQNLKEKQTTPWTFHSSKNSKLRLSPDGKRAVFQSTRSGRPQLWLLHTDGGEAKQLTTFRYGAMDPMWSKDSQHIFFTAPLEHDDDIHNQTEPSKEEEKKEKEAKKKQPFMINRLKYKSDARGFHDDTRSQIIRLTIDNSSLLQITDGDADYRLQDISPDSTTLLYTANLNDHADYELNNDLYCFQMFTKETTKLTDGKGIYHNARFSPDGSKIACFGHEFAYKGASLTELYLFDIKTKEKSCLSSDWDIEIGDAMIGDTRLGESEIGPVWNEDSSKIFFIVTNQGATELHAASIYGKKEEIYKDNNHIFGFAYNKHCQCFILGISSPTNPGEFYLLHDNGSLEALTDHNCAFLKEIALQEPEELSIQTEDNWQVQGWVLRPYAFIEGKKYPTILEIHGGPHAMYGQAFFFEMQLLAAKGYVVLYTNPRGSHGYGQSFVNACRGDYGGGDYRDVMTAVDDAIEKFSFIDTERLGVTGGSYGGFMTNWIVGHTNRFKAAVTQRSISNWLSFYGVSDIGFFFTEWEHGVNLLDDPTKLWEFSPLKYAANIETPLLILHGELDYRCPIEQGEQLFITLKHLKKEVEFIRFPNANHELSRSGDPNMRMERLQHMLRWFDTYL
ncbi:S9 family peptidase [Virgibacillus chiguensis]|uniref:Acylaminoacyl-peptidase n=1 Tax=Virgibacillus chiguensis TaxID=411959 RepID=A0A1M5PN81_9BACI|nr:S9 family peptidase [Virgibacillus chiguensis]SHH03166.1 acylaminoacyl-peptidase [Virgibacillus chiguensis]